MRRARVRHFVYMEIIRGCQMETITSRENAKIKYACRLREEEKLRTADGLFFAEGPKLCLELARGCTLPCMPPRRLWPIPQNWKPLRAKLCW